jgi:hypothetical protein
MTQGQNCWLAPSRSLIVALMWGVLGTALQRMYLRGCSLTMALRWATWGYFQEVCGTHREHEVRSVYGVCL